MPLPRRFAFHRFRIVEVKGEVGRYKRHVYKINGAQPKLCALYKVRGNAARIAEDDDEHEVRRLSVHALRLVGAPDRKRP